jgi:hypothetical protein
MTNAERASELKRLRTRVQNGDLRADLHARRDLLSSIVLLLNFNDLYHVNAAQFADILTREGFSSSMYEGCEARLDVIMGQAVTELEHSLTPPPPPQPGLVPTPALTNEQGLWWFYTALHRQNALVDVRFHGSYSRSDNCGGLLRGPQSFHKPSC